MKSHPSPISKILASVMDAHGMGRMGPLATLDRGWADAVGDTVAAHARPEKLEGRTLTVLVDNSVWMNQLHMLSSEIMEKANGVLGAGSVADIRLRIGRITAKPAPAKVIEPPIVRRKPTRAELAEIENSVSSIPDDDTRESIRRLFIASCARKKA